MSEEASRTGGVFLPYPLLGIMLTLVLTLGGGIIGMYVKVDTMNSTILMRDADRGWDALCAAFIAVPPSTFDDPLKHTGHYADYGFIIGEPDDPYSDWEASTDYALRDFTINNKMLYECITAGTSASSGGPTGTEASITDGTVTWCWRRVVG